MGDSGGETTELSAFFVNMSSSNSSSNVSLIGLYDHTDSPENLRFFSLNWQIRLIVLVQSGH